jgi:hypothetical protein
MVHGALADATVKGSFIGIPIRRGDDTRWPDVATMHARLRAGERYLSASEASTSGPDALAQLREERAVEWLQHVADACREDGIGAFFSRGAVTFEASGHDALVVSTDERGPLLDVLTQQSVMERLQAMGLRTRRTPRGHLVPAQWPRA